MPNQFDVMLAKLKGQPYQNEPERRRRVTERQHAELIVSHPGWQLFVEELSKIRDEEGGRYTRLSEHLALHAREGGVFDVMRAAAVAHGRKELAERLLKFIPDILGRAADVTGDNAPTA